MGSPPGVDVPQLQDNALVDGSGRHLLRQPVSFSFQTRQESRKTSRNYSSVLSEFFRNGQVIVTFRGKGIWQPAVDLAIEKVNDGGWVPIPSVSFDNFPFSQNDLELMVRSTFSVKAKCARVTRTTRKTASPN